MVDLSFLEKFTKGDKKKMNRYIGMYLNIAPGTFDKMEQNIKEQDWEQLRINAHSLKPQADYMGIPELKDVLIKIENNAKEGDQVSLQGLFDEAYRLHIQSEVGLRSFINDC